MILEGYSLREALYMTAITLSTVGYTEVRPLSETGQLFTTILITINVGVVAYVLAVFTSLVTEGELFRNIHIRTIGYNIKKMKNHVIVCGYGRYGREVVEHLINNDIPFVVIERELSKIQEIQKSDKKILIEESREMSPFFKLGIAINIIMILVFSWWFRKEWRSRK